MLETAGWALGVLAVLAVVIAVIVLTHLAAKKRREMFAQFAHANGWTWISEDNSFADRWTGEPFGQGDHRRAQNVIQGLRDGRPIVAFDYSYQTHTTDGRGQRSTTTHHYGMCATSMPTRVPRLQVIRENMATRIGRALGIDDIDFESEDFNRKFRVSCPDRKFASDVLHPRQLALLLHKGFADWRMEGSDLLCWAKVDHTPAQVLESLRLLDEILDGIPSFVWRDRGVTLERTGEPS